MSAEGTQHGLLRYCAGHLSRLRKRLPAVLKSWDADDLHDVRVASRRLKSALEALKPVVAPQKRKPIMKALRKIRRAFGPLRDLDVMSAHLYCFKTNTRSASAADWLADQLDKRREPLRRKIASKLKRSRPLRALKKWSAVESNIKQSFDAARLLVAKRATSDFQSFSDCADQIAKHAHARGDQIHAIRISAKKLRYRLELADAAGYPLAPKTMATFKQLQDTLGQWHDYVVLSEQALQTAIDTGLAANDPKLYEQVLNLAQQCAHRASHHLARFRELFGSFDADVDHAAPARL
jgi:CHAD domain-containing protein